MIRLYFSLVIAIAIYIALLTGFIQWIVIPIFKNTIEEEVKSVYISAKLILDEHYKQGSEEALQRFAEKNETLSSLPINIKLKSFWNFSESENSLLANNEILVVDFEDEELYIPIANSNLVAKFGPIDTSNKMQNIDNIINVIAYAAFFATILIWVWRLQKRLNHLNHTATQLGAGNLSSRASEHYSLRIGQLNRSFNQMANRIQQLIQSQKDLINAVSHELRSPISRIRLELEMLDQTHPNQRQITYITGIEDDLDDLDGLVDELLTYAKLERQSININPSEFDLCELINKLIGPLNKDKKKTLKCHLPQHCILFSDQKLVSRTIGNLIENALKYASTTVHVTVIQDTNISIYVDDDGIGVPQEKRQDVFQPFTRMDPSRTRDTGGYGLGLAIVKQTVETLQGHICIADSALGGASFQLTLSPSISMENDTP